MSYTSLITVGAALAGAYALSQTDAFSGGGGGGMMQTGGSGPLSPDPVQNEPGPTRSDDTGTTSQTEPVESEDTDWWEPPEDTKSYSFVTEKEASGDIFGVTPAGMVEKVGDASRGGGESSGNYYSKY